MVTPVLGNDGQNLKKPILVDDASTDSAADYLAGVPGITAILNETNLGFSAGTNVGLKRPRGTYLCFLNPDTAVWPGWHERLSARLQDETVGMVGPISDNIAAAQFAGHYIPLAGQTLTGVAASAAQQFAGRFVETKLLIGLCAMVRRETLDRVGLLDEDLFLGREDLELSWRLRTHGLKLLLGLDTFVHHEGGVSFSSTSSEVKKRLLFESTEALLAKVRAAYGWRPPDTDLWGIEICHR